MSMLLLGPFVILGILLFVLALKVVNNKFPHLSGIKRKFVLLGAIFGITIITIGAFCLFLAVAMRNM